MLYVAGEDGLVAHAALLAEGEGLRELSLDEARAMVPLLRPEWLRAAAYEDDAQDIDVAALHQGWLKKAKAGGTKLLDRCGFDRRPFRERPLAYRDASRPSSMPASSSTRPAPGPMWWRKASGLSPLGMQPMRRTMAVLPVPPELAIAKWPLISDSAESLVRQAGGRPAASVAGRRGSGRGA